jgi:hypothetical protein
LAIVPIAKVRSRQVLHIANIKLPIIYLYGKAVSSSGESISKYKSKLTSKVEIQYGHQKIHTSETCGKYIGHGQYREVMIVGCK